MVESWAGIWDSWIIMDTGAGHGRSWCAHHSSSPVQSRVIKILLYGILFSFNIIGPKGNVLAIL